MIRASIEVSIGFYRSPKKEYSYSSLHVNKGLLEMVKSQINLKELSVVRSKGKQENKEVIQIEEITCPGWFKGSVWRLHNVLLSPQPTVKGIEWLNEARALSRYRSGNASCGTLELEVYPQNSREMVKHFKHETSSSIWSFRRVTMAAE